MELLLLILAWALLYAAWSDLSTMTIPLWLTFGLIPLCTATRWIIAPHSADPALDSLTFALLFVPLWLLWRLGIFGGGDVKLLMALTLWFGASLQTGYFFALFAVLFLLQAIAVVLASQNPGLRAWAELEFPKLDLDAKKQTPAALSIAPAGLAVLASQGL